MYKYLPLFLLFISSIAYSKDIDIPVMDIQKNINSQISDNSFIRHIAITADNNELLLKVDIDNHHLLEYASYKAQLKYDDKSHMLFLDHIEQTDNEKLINPLEVKNTLSLLKIFDMQTNIIKMDKTEINYNKDIISIKDKL